MYDTPILLVYHTHSIIKDDSTYYHKNTVRKYMLTYSCLTIPMQYVFFFIFVMPICIYILKVDERDSNMIFRLHANVVATKVVLEGWAVTVITLPSRTTLVATSQASTFLVVSLYICLYVRLLLLLVCLYVCLSPLQSKVKGSQQAVVNQLSGIPWVVVRQLPSNCQAAVRNSSGIHKNCAYWTHTIRSNLKKMGPKQK